MSTCVDCGQQTENKSRICDPCYAVLATASRAAQGLPPTIEDPAGLAKLERLLRGAA